MRRLSVVAVVILMSVSSAPVAADGVRVLRDVHYTTVRNGCTGQVERLRLDAYLPPHAGPRPVYVWAHGGGFHSRDKGWIPAGVRSYARRGWAVLAIDYRLCDPELDPSWKFQASEDAQRDMEAAVGWARRHAGHLSFDRDKIAVGGFSAGGVMALNVAFGSAPVAAAVSHAGGFIPGVEGLVPPGAPPIAMFFGDQENVLRSLPAQLTCSVTIGLGNVCEMTTYAGAGHRVLGTRAALDFLSRHVTQRP